MVGSDPLIPDIGLYVGQKLCFPVNYSPTKSSGLPSGVRIVEGVLAGFAVRSPGVLDIILRDISAWNYNDLSLGVERLPEDFVACFHVLIHESLVHTVGILLNGTHENGRGQLVVTEVPYTFCPKCGERVNPNDHWRYCGGCGERLAVGWVGDYPAVAYPGPNRCPYCWYIRPKRAVGRHCVWCGGDRALIDDLRQIPPVRVRAVLTSGKKRFGRISAVLDSFEFGKKFISQPAKLYAIARDIEWERGGAAWRELPTGFETVFEVSLVEKDVRATLDVMRQGGVVRVSEPLAPCQYCCAAQGLPLIVGDGTRDNLHAFGVRLPRLVRGLYCMNCGRRSRIFPYQWSGRSRAAKRVKGGMRHSCGAVVAASDFYCQGCGGDLERYHLNIRMGQRDDWGEIATRTNLDHATESDGLMLLDRFD